MQRLMFHKTRFPVFIIMMSYKTSIKLEGYIDDFIEMKDYRTVYLSEDTDVKGKIIGIFRTDDYIQGCWMKDDVIIPCI